MSQNRWPLPTEITNLIIQLACCHELDGPPYRFYNRQRFRCTHVPDIAQYSCVCREWRDIVESLTFRNLRLNRTRLAQVDRIMCPRRRAYVRTIDLDVELQPYDDKVYGDFETTEEKEINSFIFSETIRLFFVVFSRWTLEGSYHGFDVDTGQVKERVGVSLCITCFSPSDVQRCGEAKIISRDRNFVNRDIFGDRYIHSILQLLPAAAEPELPVVESVVELISGQEQHISASAWASIINSLPNAKKIDINFWENEKKDLELRKQLRNEIGNALARTRCADAEVTLSCSYTAPKDHASTPPTLIDTYGADDAFTRGLRAWMRQLKVLRLSDVVIAPEMFQPAAASGDDEEEARGWPHLERLEFEYAAVTPHGTWLLERNPKNSPRDRPSPVVDLEEYDQGSLRIEVPAPEDLHEHDFRTVPVAAEMDRLFANVAQAARRMPALRRLYLVTFDGAIQWGDTHHGFLYRYDADVHAAEGMATAIAHWGDFPGYEPGQDVVRRWREMVREVHGCELQVLIDENEV